MPVVAMAHVASVRHTCVHTKAFTGRRPVRSTRLLVCKASQEQAAKPTKAVVGVAGALIGAAAAMQLFTVPAADAIATQTDMFARPQMSENKGQNTGQPSQQKPGNQPESGAALASSGAAEKGGMPGASPADENSRMQRSTSGSMSAAGPGTKASN